MHPWVKAFQAWVENNGGRKAAPEKLGHSKAAIHMWWHGVMPSLRTLKSIEEKTGGAVPAALALVPASGQEGAPPR